MIICFKEKHDKRFVEGPDRNAILAHVLRERIADTYGLMFDGEDDGVSVWYAEDTEKAKKYLDEGKATQYMSFRRSCEYEDWYEIAVEKIEA
jgi:hypothetical protein